MFQVRIRLKPPFEPDSVIEDVIEIHYNYLSMISGGEPRIAFECKDTGYTYAVSDVIEFEATIQKEA